MSLDSVGASVSAPPEPAGPTPVDVHVGARIRMRRKMLGVTQQMLADKIGVTFPQLQKYERGTNRVSASKLYAVAQALLTPLAYFFRGLPGSEAEDVQPWSSPRIDGLLGTLEGVELVQLFPQVAERSRRPVLDLIRALANDPDEETG